MALHVPVACVHCRRMNLLPLWRAWEWDLQPINIRVIAAYLRLLRAAALRAVLDRSLACSLYVRLPGRSGTEDIYHVQVGMDTCVGGAGAASRCHEDG